MILSFIFIHFHQFHPLLSIFISVYIYFIHFGMIPKSPVFLDALASLDFTLVSK